jgi:hypothetical protein
MDEIKDQPADKLQELLKQLSRDKENKVDYIANADQLTAIYDLGTKKYYLSLKTPSGPTAVEDLDEISDLIEAVDTHNKDRE